MVDLEGSKSKSIDDIFAKPGFSWDFRERDEVKIWLCEVSRLNELRYFAKRHLGSWSTLEDAEDACQDFLAYKLDRLIDLYTPNTSNRQSFWLFCKFCFKRFCWRRAKSIQRTAEVTQPLESEDEDIDSHTLDVAATAAEESATLPGTPINQFRSLAHSELREVFEELISTMRQDYQEVLAMYYVDELAIREIADSLQQNENTIKQWLHRARTQLKNSLIKRGFEL